MILNVIPNLFIEQAYDGATDWHHSMQEQKQQSASSTPTPFWFIVMSTD
jgi:hypothetical protein